MKRPSITVLKTPRLKPGKRLVGLMLLWAVLTPLGVVLTVYGGPTTPATLYPTTIVTFPDENLEGAIRDALGKAAGKLAELTEPTAYERDIAALTGIQHLSNMTSLDLWGNQISDISPLVANSDLGQGGQVLIENNPLDLS